VLQPVLFVPMTGQAEEKREVLPDPTNPEIQNSSFEEVAGDPPILTGWYYQRQLELVADDDAPLGKQYATFRNAEPGRTCQTMQGFPVDGREVQRLEIRLWARGREIRPGQNLRQLPMVVVTFYDEKRATIGEKAIGPWRGSFPWQSEVGHIPVPIRAREAIIRLGLLGAVGEICFDDVQVKAADQR
jgi:protein-L-isoaspartate(D-aspartate) O-methyltransferase